MAWSASFGLRLLLVSGLEVSSGLAMSIGGSKDFEYALRLLWRLYPVSAAGLWLASKVNTETVAFL
jgi:hypothetical protein